MICNNCGHLLEESNKFCPNCGTKVEPQQNANKEQAVEPIKDQGIRSSEHDDTNSQDFGKDANAKRQLDFDEINWNLEGYPTEESKETEDIDFNWEPVIDEHEKSVQESLAKQQTNDDENLDEKKHSVEEVIFGKKDLNGNISATIRMENPEDLSKTTRMEKVENQEKEATEKEASNANDNVEEKIDFEISEDINTFEKNDSDEDDSDYMASLTEGLASLEELLKVQIEKQEETANKIEEILEPEMEISLDENSIEAEVEKMMKDSLPIQELEDLDDSEDEEKNLEDSDKDVNVQEHEVVGVSLAKTPLSVFPEEEKADICGQEVEKSSSYDEVKAEDNQAVAENITENTGFIPPIQAEDPNASGKIGNYDTENLSEKEKAAMANSQSIEAMIREDQANGVAQTDNRITFQDVFKEEISAEKNQDKAKPKKHTGLKVIAIILCILIVLEIVALIIKNAAPDSAAAEALQNIFNLVYGKLAGILG